MVKWEYTEHELWRFNENGDSIFHVFSVVAAGETVLAFSEARKGDGSDDKCPHDIRMKKSVDGGKTFLPDRTVIPAEGRCWANPSPIYDGEAGRLFLFYSENLNGTKTGNYLIFSDDLGQTWSAPRDIAPILDAAGAPVFRLAGPGHGIQLKRSPHQGRLLMQFWCRNSSRFGPAQERGYCVCALYSDDHGDTWQVTKRMGQGNCTNESRLVETNEGILWVMRTKGVRACRSFSTDGGLTWASITELELPDARCCDIGTISLCAKEGYEDMVLISRVSDPAKRLDMEIRISRDGGKTFPDTFRLMPGDAMPGYSDMCIIEEDVPVVGLLHCRNNHVLFSRISLQTLTGGKYENTSRNCWLQ